MCVVQRIMHAGTVSKTQRLDPLAEIGVAIVGIEVKIKR